ncbi:pilus assembly protein TadG-related protein [Methylobacterium sp. CB376]|uniref:pilus assembly protein TadG-related protein n=1 Tax=unclassified Methylobacterium TaxID=2615210 RepID=UPI0012376FD6|nr:MULTISPECIES: pilus assembly protein TadG-related protein [Methylobacterium]WFT83405.1 pilus assembly protein TadG-related protein [Methylobacterium nodulans]
MWVSLSAFRTNVSGNVAAIFGLTLLPLMFLLGSSVDLSRTLRERARLQALTDQAALSAVTSSSASQDPADTVQTFFPQPSDPDQRRLAPTATVTVEGSTVTVTSTQNVATAFTGILGVAQIPITARSTAAPGNDGPPVCVLALNPTATDAILFSGNATVVASNCVIYSNSSAANALTRQGSASVQATGYCAVGGTNLPTSTTPRPQSGCPRLDDPFRNLPLASGSGCKDAGEADKPNRTQTLDPGVYCGLTLKGTVTLNPGLYLIKGPLDIGAQASVSGQGVTLYLTGGDANFTINGGASLDLSAMSTGSYAGILLMQDRQVSGSTGNLINGGASLKLTGAIYTPTQSVEIRGNGSFGQQSAFMPIIADTITFSGNAMASADLRAMQPAAPLPRGRSSARLAN